MFHYNYNKNKTRNKKFFPFELLHAFQLSNNNKVLEIVLRHFSGVAVVYFCLETSQFHKMVYLCLKEVSVTVFSSAKRKGLSVFKART